MSAAQYSFLPPLLDEEFENLKISISERGVEVPIIVDQCGAVIDGHHRRKACDKLKLFCPQEVREFASEAERYEVILSLNCRRRQLNREQKRKLIEAYMRRDPQIADNFLGELIGVSKNTVAAVRQELESTCQIDKFEKLRGKDGKVRRRQKRIVTNTEKETSAAIDDIGDLPDTCDGKFLDIFTAKRRAKTNRQSIERSEERDRLEAGVLEDPQESDRIRLYHCEFQQLESRADIEPESAAVFLTDPPYGGQFMDQWNALGELAERVLQPGGLFIAHAGQYRLDEKMQQLGKHLTYRWTGNSCWQDQANHFHPLNCISKWIPIVIYSKGDWKHSGKWCDSLHFETKEKEWHLWQRPLAEVERLVSYFSSPSDLVIDPCGGGFTTAIACERTGRRCISCDIDKVSVVKGKQRLKAERTPPTTELDQTLPCDTDYDFAGETMEAPNPIYTLPMDTEDGPCRIGRTTSV